MESMSTPRHRWIVFGAMTGVYFSFGIAVTAIAPMLTAVRDDLGVSRGAMGFALGAWALIYIVTAPLAAGSSTGRARLVARARRPIGQRLTVLRAAAQGLGSLWLAIAFFGVFGPLVSASAPKLMATWFPDENERRRGVGWYSVAPAIGGTITLAVTNPVLLEWFDSWRQVLVFEATIGAVATAVWIVVWNRAERPTTTRVELGCGRVGQPILPVSPGLVGDPVDPVRRLRPVLPEPWNQQLDADDPGGVQRYEPEHRRRMAGGRRTRLDRRRCNHSRLRHTGTYASADGGALWCGGPRDGRTLDHPDLTSRTHRRDRWGGGALVPLAIVTLLAADRVSVANTGIANGLWFSIAEIGGVSGRSSLAPWRTPMPATRPRS